LKRRSISRPPDFTLFTDEDTGFHPRQIAPSILIESGLSVVCLGTHFARQTPDHVWLETCGKNGWIAVTHDKRMRLDERTMVSLLKGGARVITLIGDWTHEELATNLVNSIFRIEQALRKQPAPCIIKLHMADPNGRKRGTAGKVEIYRTRDDLIRHVGHLR